MKKILLICAAALAIAACQKGPQPGDLVDLTFTAKLPSVLGYTPESKVAVNGNTLAWEATDAVAIYDGKTINSFTVAPDGAMAELKGQGAFQADAYYAVLPFDAAKKFSNGTASVDLPSAQKEGEYVSRMAGMADEQNEIALKELCGYMEFDLPAGVISINVSAADGAAVAGTMSVNAETGKVKSVEGANSISFVPAETTFPEGKQIVAIAPMDYANGLSVILRMDGGAKKTYTTPAVALERGMITKLDSLKSVVASEFIISSAADFKAWVDAKDSWSADDKVSLECDIDMSSYPDWVPVNFEGTFNGNGHKIYNFVQNVTMSDATKVTGFFNLVTGPVSNVVFGSKDGQNYDGKSKITVTGENGWCYVGVIAKAKANLTNITNFVNVEIAAECKAKIRGACVLGLANIDGMVIDNVVNYGSFKALNEMKTDAQETIYGGIISCADAGEAGQTVYIKNCKNYGEVLSLDPYTTCVGGVLSNCPSTKLAVLENCENSGPIAINTTQTPASYKEGYVGGVAGLLNANATVGTSLTNCVNHANLTVSGVTVGNLGGIAGRVPTGVLKDCTNNGNITFDGNVTGKALLIGGITGGMYVGGTLEGCINNGDVTSNKNQVNRLGGIVGTVNSKDIVVKNCTNKGACTIKRTDANANWQACGGIVGFQEKSDSFALEGCVNSGAVTVSMENNTTHANQVSAGGIIGLCVLNASLKNNQNTGNVSALTTGSALAYAGGIIGWANNVTIKSDGDKSVCAVSAKDKAGAAAGNNIGAISSPKLGGSVNGTALTSANLATLAVGEGTAAASPALAN